VEGRVKAITPVVQIENRRKKDTRAHGLNNEQSIESQRFTAHFFRYELFHSTVDLPPPHTHRT